MSLSPFIEVGERVEHKRTGNAGIVRAVFGSHTSRGRPTARVEWDTTPTGIAYQADLRRRWTSTEAVRRYREDPDKREKDRARARRWKRDNLGQPGEPRP